MPDVDHVSNDIEDEDVHDASYASSDSEAYAYDSRDEASFDESSFESYDDEESDESFEEEDEEIEPLDFPQPSPERGGGETREAVVSEETRATPNQGFEGDVEEETLAKADDEVGDDMAGIEEERIEEEDRAAADGEEDFGSEEEAEEQTNEDAEAKFRAAGTAAPMLAKSFGSAVREAANGALAAVKPKSAPVEPLVKPDPSDEDATRTYELQMLRIKLLRLASRLKQSPRNTVVAQVIYRLELAEQLKAGKGAQKDPSNASFDRAVALAQQAENESSDADLDFTCTILLLGKSGVGKSAVINSLLGEGSAPSGTADADTTKKVTLIEKKIHGMTLRLIDTPGLQASASDIRYNSAIMNDAKKFTKQHKPDIVLYFDRLDIPSRSDAADLPLLKQITNTLGQAIWFNAIVVLTHAATAPPDGANGQPISYEMYVAQRSHIVQQTIRQAAGDMRLMNPVALRRKSSALPHEPRRRARLAERSSMEAATFIVVLRVQDSHRGQRSVELASGTTKGQQGWPRRHAGTTKGAPASVPPLFLITTRKPRRLMEYDDDGFEDLENEIISGEPSPYDIPADQMEPMPTPKQVSIPAPDPQLPLSFDGDAQGHHYRQLESNQQWACRPIVDAHGWDHETGVEGFSVEHQFVLKDLVPGVVQAQISKDKKDSNFGFEGEMSIPHTRSLISTTGVDIQTVGKDLVYTRAGGDEMEVLRHRQDHRRSLRLSRRRRVGARYKD